MQVNRQHGSIKFLLRLTFFLTVFVSSSSYATLKGVFLTQHCDAFLTNETGYTNLAYNQTPQGSELYHRIREIVGTHSSSLIEIIKIPRHSKWTVDDVLKFIADDRERIERGLTDLLAEFPENDDHRKMVGYVLDQYSHVLKKARFARQVTDLSRVYGPIPIQYVSAATHPSLMKFLYDNWAMNRSYVSELLTAFELKGAYALGAKIYELLPQDHLEEFVKVFEYEGKSQLLELEIDVATRDPQTRQEVWVEVKNVNNRLTDKNDSAINGYRDKKAGLREFIQIIEDNQRLKYLFPQSIAFVWLIRGAGVDKHMREKHAARGLNMYDQYPDGINNLFDARTKHFRNMPLPNAPGRSYREKKRLRAS